MLCKPFVAISDYFINLLDAAELAKAAYYLEFRTDRLSEALAVAESLSLERRFGFLEPWFRFSELTCTIPPQSFNRANFLGFQMTGARARARPRCFTR